MPCVLDLVNGLFASVPGFVNELLDLALGVVERVLDLTSAAIGLALGFEVLVSREGSDDLFPTALHLIRLLTYRVHNSLRHRTQDPKGSGPFPHAVTNSGGRSRSTTVWEGNRRRSADGSFSCDGSRGPRRTWSTSRGRVILVSRRYGAAGTAMILTIRCSLP